MAILNADASPGSTINFNIGASGVVETITPASALPAITAAVTIDATTEAGYTSSPLINLNGAGLNANGLQITASNTTIRGLAVGAFGQTGILISGDATGDLITNDFVGTNATGTVAAANAIGIEISGSANNTLNTDLVSGNTGNGVVITGSGSTGNVVVSCKIGTDAAGTAAIGNGGEGVDVQNGALGNTIGAAASPPVSTNLALWLNADQGVVTNSNGQVTSWADESGNNHNGAVQGSGLTLVKNAIDGQNAVQFTGSGDLLLSGQVLTSQQYTVLAVVTDTHTNTSFHEVFSDWNPSNGITSVFLGTTNNTPDRARFTDYMGGAEDPNHTQTGVGSIASPTQPFVLTGVSATGDASIYQDQTLIADKGSAIPTRNLSYTYYVGDQGSAAAEYWQGDISELLVYNSALSQAQLATDWSYLEGKYLPNVISGNTGNGIEIDSGSTLVEGNYIGTNAAGTAALPNAIGINVTAASNTIGGTTAGSRNIVSGNGAQGIYLNGSGATANLVEGNYVGTNAAGTAALGNGGQGVQIDSGASNNTIGGLTATPGTAPGNVISGNDQRGVWIIDAGTASNVVAGNIVGLDSTGAVAVPNAYQGVEVGSAGTGDVIGGTSAGAGNVISANGGGYGGILISGTSGTLVAGNLIGTDLNGTLALGNTFGGIQLIGSSQITIGGTTAAARNVISGNGGNGVLIENAVNFYGLTAAAADNLVEGNYIGSNAAGKAQLANVGDGVVIEGGATGNTIGGTVAGTGNVISGNTGVGVLLVGDNQATADGGSNVVEGNDVGTNASGNASVPNGFWGVEVNNAPGNTIGGTTAGAGNLISGNTEGGVAIYGSNAVNNTVQGNVIGLVAPAAGTGAMGNGYSGIYVGAGSGFGISSGTASGAASSTTIGDTTALGANTISANGGYGIWLAGGTASDTIQGNNIGTNTTGSVRRDNAQAAIQIDSGSAQSSAGKLVVDGTIAGGGTFTVAAGGTLSAASAASSAFSITPTTFTNNGTLEAASGQTLTIGGANWVNNGTITANGATINLGGTFTTAALGNLTAAGATINLTGTLTNTGAVLNLNPSEGSWHVVAGTIRGGTIDASGGSQLSLTGVSGPVGSGGTLDGVTLNGNLDLSATNANATVLDGLTLNGTATLGAYADLYFSGSQTLGGTGTVLFQNQYANALIAGGNGTTLTIGPGITVHGGGNQSFSAQIGHSGYWPGGTNVSVVVQGTINADTAGMTIALDPSGTGTLTTTGTLSAQNGGTLYVGALVDAGRPGRPQRIFVGCDGRHRQSPCDNGQRRPVQPGGHGDVERHGHILVAAVAGGDESGPGGRRRRLY